MSINEDDHTVTLQNGAVIQLYSEPHEFAKTTGWVTWNASITLIRYLEQHQRREGGCAGMTVADLSTGNGLVALAAAHLGAVSVVATEVPACSPLTRVNVGCNPSVKNIIQVKDYKWGDRECPIQRCDLVLACDLLFIAIRDSICDEFHTTLVDICKSNNKLLFCYEERVLDKEQRFLNKLKNDLKVLQVPIDTDEYANESHDMFYEAPSIQMYCLSVDK